MAAGHVSENALWERLSELLTGLAEKTIEQTTEELTLALRQ